MRLTVWQFQQFDHSPVPVPGSPAVLGSGVSGGTVWRSRGRCEGQCMGQCMGHRRAVNAGYLPLCHRLSPVSGAGECSISRLQSRQSAGRPAAHAAGHVFSRQTKRRDGRPCTRLAGQTVSWQAKTASWAVSDAVLACRNDSCAAGRGLDRTRGLNGGLGRCGAFGLGRAPSLCVRCLRSRSISRPGVPRTEGTLHELMAGGGGAWSRASRATRVSWVSRASWASRADGRAGRPGELGGAVGPGEYWGGRFNRRAACPTCGDGRFSVRGFCIPGWGWGVPCYSSHLTSPPEKRNATP